MIAELYPLVVGRHLSRARAAGPHAIVFETSGLRERWLWIDAGRGTAGLYLVARDTARRLVAGLDADAPGRARQALLHIRKHVEGGRVRRLARVPGERTVLIEVGEVVLALRPGGAGPALTLAAGGAAIASLGEGPPAWPPPEEAPAREWDRVDPLLFAASVEASLRSGRSLVGAVLAACPGLGPLLARELDGCADSLRVLQSRLASPRPTLVLCGPTTDVACTPPAAGGGSPSSAAPHDSRASSLGGWHDADFAPAGAVALAPLPLVAAAGTPWIAASWLEAAEAYLEARLRGLAFARSRRGALDRVRRSLRRLEQLLVHLAEDLAALENEAQLRRRGEALLAFGHALPPGASSAELPDPSDPAGRLLVSLDPRASVPANADRLFERARRNARARRQIELRLAEARSALVEARSSEARILDARDLADLGPAPAATGTGAPGGRRHYLTGRGLSVLVGRSARENHQLTFQTARPEDLWLHARDVPGAHVVLRDNEGRASAEDLREAAEVAAFFSEARGSGLVDVHVTRRKHVRPARGGPGRVFVAHSDTLRVHARDPDGRLRRR